jgi:hypothetical protein
MGCMKSYSFTDPQHLSLENVMLTEPSHQGMEVTYEELGKPGIFRNDRLWLAGDHVVDPRIMDAPKVKPLLESSEKARKVFKLSEHQGNNV